MRSFKPALARDYDVFFAAIGLLCGGILFFQGWRLDPILQFGQFLLAGTTVFFGYESVRLRGIAADQARRSSYFDDDPPQARMPRRGENGNWDDSFDPYERLDEQGPIRRRFSSQESRKSDQIDDDENYRPIRASRAAIPEEAASRNRPRRTEQRDWNEDQSNQRSRRMARFNRGDQESNGSQSFGERRGLKQEQRRGSRPSANPQRNNQTSSRGNQRQEPGRTTSPRRSYSPPSRRGSSPEGSPIRPTEPKDAAFSPSNREQKPNRQNEQTNRPRKSPSSTYSQRPPSQRRNPGERPRDNNSRFDD